MVSTRGHPDAFEEKSLELTPNKSPRGRKAVKSTLPWSHTPSNVTLLWLFISLPLVIWDTGYVMLRPHSMPGGKFHFPWKPYDLYGRVDHIYGWKAYNSHNGFTSAQGSLNIVETLMYLYYLYVAFIYGKATNVQGRGAPKASSIGFLGEARSISGQQGVLALLVGYSAAVMTVSKTVLYWLNEYYSGFDNIGHNSARDLILLWIIPNGAWLVLPTYMIYVLGSEIVQGLATATGATTSSLTGAKDE